MLVSNPKFLQSSPSQGKSQSAWAACKWPDWWQSGSEAPWGRWPTHCRWPKEAHCWGDPNSSSHFNWWFPGGWCRTWWFHRISQKGQVWYLIIRSTIMSMLLLIFTNYFHFLPLKKNECVIITNLNTPEHIWFGMPFLVLKHWWNSTWDVPTCSGQQRTTRFEGTIAKAVRTKERGSPTSTPVVAWHVEAGWPSETRARVSILQFQQGDHRQKCLVLRCFRF